MVHVLCLGDAVFGRLFYPFCCEGPRASVPKELPLTLVPNLWHTHTQTDKTHLLSQDKQEPIKHWMSETKQKKVGKAFKPDQGQNNGTLLVQSLGIRRVKSLVEKEDALSLLPVSLMTSRINVVTAGKANFWDLFLIAIAGPMQGNKGINSW